MADTATVYKAIKTCTIAGTSITKMLTASVSNSGTEYKSQGDNNVYPTALGVVTSEVEVTFEGQDINAMLGIAVGATGSTSFICEGAGGATPADTTVTIALSTVISVSATGNHGSEGTASITVKGYSSDGTTAPIAIT